MPLDLYSNRARIIFKMLFSYHSYSVDERERENVSIILYSVQSAEAFDSCLFSSHFILLKSSVEMVVFEETGGNQKMQNV